MIEEENMFLVRIVKGVGLGFTIVKIDDMIQIDIMILFIQISADIVLKRLIWWYDNKH